MVIYAIDGMHVVDESVIYRALQLSLPMLRKMKRLHAKPLRTQAL